MLVIFTWFLICSRIRCMASDFFMIIDFKIGNRGFMPFLGGTV
jgi:hypothetical protein